jgi:ABC-type transport system involved in multi-copper enzyme maturation permease subunit
MMAIIGMTWKEMLRKRMLLLTLLLTCAFLIAFWFVAGALAHGAQSDMSRLDPNSAEYIVAQYSAGVATLVLGFFFAAFVIAFLSIFSSFTAVAGEAEQAVLQAVLPRPIKRWHWYAGRWAGYVSLGVGYAALLFATIILIASARIGVPLDAAALLKSFALFASVVPLLISVAMLGSCYLSAVGNGVLMTMLFGAGWLGGMMERIVAISSLVPSVTKPLANIAGILSLLMPADALQRRVLAEMLHVSDLQGVVDLARTLGPFSFTQAPSNAFLVYAACYTAAAFALGLRAFGRKDF